MSCCFYDRRATGIMAGIDKHWFLHVTPTPAPFPVKIIHLVGASQNWLCNGKHTTSVTSEGHQMMQKGFALKLVPHVPINFFVGAHPTEAAMIAYIIAASKSEPKLFVSSVSGQSQPLATCAVMAVGANFNCGGIGGVFNMNSVVTQPSFGDYLTASVAVGVDLLIGAIIGKALGDRFKGIAEPLVEIMVEHVKSIILDPIVETVIDESRSMVNASL